MRRSASWLASAGCTRTSRWTGSGPSRTAGSAATADSFAVTVATVRKLAAAGLLQGLLCTPNSLAEDEEYRELCEFAAGNGASYVLMNPLSSMGRGVKSRGKLSSGEEHMRRIRALTAPFDSPDLEIVHIRFPSTGGQPLAGCEAGTIIYVFTAGGVTVCPYLVFAARTPQSRHDPGESPSSATSSPTRTSPRGSTPTGSPDGTRWAPTPPAGPAASPGSAVRAARQR